MRRPVDSFALGAVGALVALLLLGNESHGELATASRLVGPANELAVPVPPANRCSNLTELSEIERRTQVSDGTQTAVYLLPNFLETSARASSAEGGADNSIHVLYADLLGEDEAAELVTVSLHLYRDDGSPVTSLTGNVCDPCTFALADRESVSADFQELVSSAGGFANPTESGFATISVTVDVNIFFSPLVDLDHVSVMSEIINSC